MVILASVTVQEDKFLSIADLAERLQMSERTIRRQVIAGEIPGAFKIGGLWRFPPDVLDQLQARAVEARS